MGYFLTEPFAETATESTSERRYPLGAKKGLGAPFSNPILSTKYWDSDTKTYAYQLRDYGPSIARWLSRDPFEEWAGMNVYAFCANYPIGYVDYDGRGYGPPLGGTHGGPAAGNAPPAETGLPPSTCSDSEEGVIRNKPPFPGVPYFVDCECGKKKRCVDREKCTRFELSDGGVVQCIRFYWQAYDTVCTPCE